MSIVAPTTDARIAAFAAAVRAHLDDLGAEELEDLTGGLEADLLEEAADRGGTIVLGDPARFADELRNSAGLPERTDRTSAWDAAHDRIRSGWSSVEQKLRDNPVTAGVLDFALALRPVWWLLRAWAAYSLIAIVVFGSPSILPSSLTLWVLLLALSVVSVHWGRGRWAPTRFWRGLRTAASVGAVICLPFLANYASNELTAGDADQAGSYVDPTGLTLDGQRIYNLFAYDANGDLLTEVQLFDQNGDPVTTVGSIYGPTDSDYDPAADSYTVPFSLSGSTAGRA